MARFYFKRGNKKIYVKEIDKPNMKIYFTENPNEAYKRGGCSFYPNAEKTFIKRFFKEEYPELENLKLEETFSDY